METIRQWFARLRIPSLAVVVIAIAIVIVIGVLVLRGILVQAPMGTPFYPLAQPTASNATVFNAVSAGRIDADIANATTLNVTTFDAAAARANTLNAQSYSSQLLSTTILTATNLTLGDGTFSGAVSFGTIGGSQMMYDCTVCPRYVGEFNHGLGSIPTSCVAAGATDVNTKLASIYDLTTTSGKVIVSTQGQVFWLCGK